MTEQTTAAPSQSQSPSQSHDLNVVGHTIAGESVVGYAIIGCMVVGVIGVFKAIESDGLNSAACLLASVAAFATVCWIYLRKN